MLRSPRALAIAIAVSLLALCAAPVADAQTRPATPAELTAFGLADGRVATFPLIENTSAGELLASVEIVPGSFLDLRLEKYSMRAADFQVLVDNGLGLNAVPTPPVTTFRGEVLGLTGSSVRASLIHGGMRATIRMPNAVVWSIQPLRDAFPGSARDEHIVSRVRDTLPHLGLCGVTATGVGSTTQGQSLLGGVPGSSRICELGIDVDFPFYQDRSSSLTTTLNDVEAVMNAVDGVFGVPAIDVTFEISRIVVRTVSGTYSEFDAGLLLDEFRDNWNVLPESSIRRDLAHLFTGRNMTGSTIGIAVTPAVCGSNEYGLSESNFSNNFNSRVGLTAHEIGHNFAAFHCNAQATCRVMCSGLGGCNGLNPLTFAATPESQIIARRNSVSCLSTLPLSVALPFEDTFPSSNISGSNWIFNDGVTSSTAGQNEPSGSRSLNLNAASSNEFSDDEIRSNRILASGATQLTISYYVQRSGVPSGGQLFVEYLNQFQDWQSIETVTSNGVSQSTFVFRSFSLPSNAQHDELRIRFRTDVDSTSQDFYVDDVRVADADVPPTLLDISPQSGPGLGNNAVTITGEDFSPSAQATIGGLPLLNQTVVDSQTITGLSPGGSPGAVDVQVSQGSFTDTLVDAYLFSDTSLRVTAGSGPPAGSATVEVQLLSDIDITAVSFSGTYSDDLIVTGVRFDGTPLETAAFAQAIVEPSGSPPFFTVGSILNFMPPITLIPPGTSTLAFVDFEVATGATPGAFETVELLGGFGSPPVLNEVITEEGLALTPVAIDGSVEIIAGIPFVRGDIDGVAPINLADVITSLGFLFGGGSVPCAQAVDFDDNGVAELSDIVALLAFLFSGGGPPEAPFPNPGLDPTPDPLGC